MNARKALVRGGAALGGTAMLAAAMWLHSLRPQVRATELDPIRTDGAIGEKVVTRDFSIRVEKVDAARSLEPGFALGDPPPVGTDGVYLIVSVRAMAEREPVELRTAVLETPGGHTFRADPRPAASVGRPAFEPLIWTPARYVFELPEKRVEGARLVVGTGGLLPQLSSAADIDLRLTKARAGALVRAAADRYRLQEAPR